MSAFNRPLMLSLVAIVGLGPAVATAAAPAPIGTETAVGFGAGSWQASTADTPDTMRWGYTGLEFDLALSVRHRWDSGLTLVGDTSVAPTFIQGRSTLAAGDWLEPEYAPADVAFAGTAIMRVGWHGGYGGVELGGGVASFPGTVPLPVAEEKERTWLPSARAWAGKPDIVYAFGQVAAGPVTSVNEGLVLVGVGHASDALHLDVGAWDGVGNVRFGIATRPGVRVGADTTVVWGDAESERANWRGLIVISIEHARVGEDLY